MIVSKIQGRTFFVRGVGTESLSCNTHWVEVLRVSGLAEYRLLLIGNLSIVFLFDLLELVIEVLEWIWTLKEVRVGRLIF